MNRSFLNTIALLGTLLATMAMNQRAEALPFVDVGLKAGFGSGVVSGDVPDDAEFDITTTAVGLAGSFDLAVLQLEINVLYHTLTVEESDVNFWAIPIIGRFDISPVPMFKLAIGGGFERRFYTEDKEGVDPELNYVPLSVRSDFSIPLVGTLGVEGRFNYQLGDDDIKIHETMIFVHAFL